MNNNEQNNVNARIRAEGQKLGKKAILGYGFASLVGGIACAITAVLLFTCVPLSGTAKVIYYVVFTILFWISYSTWYVPYTAFGAEIAIDYDSRTKLRVPALYHLRYAAAGNSTAAGYSLIIAAVIMAFFPLTKKRHEMLIAL